MRAPLLVRVEAPRSDICVAYSLRVRTLKLAADRMGGARKLRDRLGASSVEMAGWISGMHEPPDAVFLRTLELLLDHLDAEEADRRR